MLVQHASEYPGRGGIGVRAYDHPNKSYGRIKTPEFKIVGWVPKKNLHPRPRRER